LLLSASRSRIAVATPKPKPAMTKAQMLKKLSAMETKLWEAWKNKDVKPRTLKAFPNKAQGKRVARHPGITKPKYQF